ncbi:aminodeoxychorismate synthase component I [Salinisphaera sp. Q1T1-3]|uniref:aminodeoxychorismate synthase component I n=1 Tax=Salinisphaera sp. Q1T1-3 TaxID=2321229 RepID=UPI000E729876|nr:aminodeoxychorismate synthase component I [Salinisphaera sp. Q1T1-3]RJS95093.1 aminodeoxychorismate synthase component I [Salinisphaera sp. Q1T1-3]
MGVTEHSSVPAGRESTARGQALSRLTLDSACCIALYRLAADEPELFPFLLESSAGAAAQSRYDLLLADPGATIRVDRLDRADAFFDELDAAATAAHCAGVPDLPFIGGWFLYLGYEMAAGVEPSLRLPPDPRDPFPHALAVRCRAGAIHDRATGVIHVIAEPESTMSVAEIAAYLCKDTANEIDEAMTMPAARWTEAPAQSYLDAVARARDYVAAGDVFQANLARTWAGTLFDDWASGDIYRALRRANPAPFSGLMQWSGGALISSSPERLLSIRDGQASMRPIAGTRRRVPGRDHDTSTELVTHPKERAEHIMLIDLVRNDLGRICRPGTVRVDELMTVESYAHVHHIVSNVTGHLAGSIGPAAALRAVFPGGTITGCPKVRCMEIIAELEDTGRGAYTGAMGYLSRCGTLDTNIVIRSLVQHGRTLTLRTGAGIVADSLPQAELEETRHKATGVLRAFVDADGACHG